MPNFQITDSETGKRFIVRGAKDRAEAERAAREHMGIPISDNPDYGVDPEGMKRAADVITSGTMGGVLGGVSGGPVGAVAGALAGAGGEFAAQEVRKRTGSEVAGAGAGVAADLAITTLLNRGRPSAALGSMAETVRPTVRASRILDDAGLLGKIGTEGAGDIADTVVTRYQALEAAEDQAWATAKRFNPTARVASQGIKKAAGDVLMRMRLQPEMSETAKLVFGKDFMGKPNIGDDVGLEELQALHSAISHDVRMAALDPKLSRRGVGASDLRKAVDDALDQIALQSPNDDAAVQSLRDARASSAAKHKAIPEDSVLFDAVVSRKAFDQPERAMQLILNSRQPVKEVKRIRKLVAGSTPQEIERVERALKRAAVSGYFGRVTGGTGVIAPRTSGAAAERASGSSKVYEEIFGKDGFAALQKWNRKLNESVRKKNRRMLPEVRTRQSQGGSLVTAETGIGGVVGAALGYGVAGPSGAAAGAIVGGTTSAVLKSAAERWGPNAARSIAIEALLDPDVMEIVAKKGASRSFVTNALETFVRRGIIQWTDISDTTTPSSDIDVEPEGVRSWSENPSP